MKRFTFLSACAALAVPAMVLSACTESDEPAPGKGNAEGGKYVFATTVQGSNGNTYVLLHF